MTKEYTLDHDEIDILRGIIGQTLNRPDLPDDEVIGYWNNLDQGTRDEAAWYGINHKYSKQSIVDDLEENFPKFD